MEKRTGRIIVPVPLRYGKDADLIEALENLPSYTTRAGIFREALRNMLLGKHTSVQVPKMEDVEIEVKEEELTDDEMDARLKKLMGG